MHSQTKQFGVATSCHWWTARTTQFDLTYCVHCLIFNVEWDHKQQTVATIDEKTKKKNTKQLSYRREAKTITKTTNNKPQGVRRHAHARWARQWKNIKIQLSKWIYCDVKRKNIQRTRKRGEQRNKHVILLSARKRLNKQILVQPLTSPASNPPIYIFFCFVYTFIQTYF